MKFYVPFSSYYYSYYWGHGISGGVEEKTCENSRGWLKKKWELQGCSRKTNVEFPRYYFSLAHSPHPWPSALGPQPHLLFYSPQSKSLFCSPHVSKLLFHGPEWSKLLFHSPVDRKYFLYFCIVKISNFSIEGR